MLRTPYRRSPRPDFHDTRRSSAAPQQLYNRMYIQAARSFSSAASKNVGFHEVIKGWRMLGFEVVAMDRGVGMGSA